MSLDAAMVLLLPLAPIAWGALCAAIMWAFLSIIRPAPSARWYVSAGVIGLLTAEFELVRIAIGWGYDGRCMANTDIMQKLPRFRPCSIWEWRREQLCPGFIGNLVWYWRAAVAATYSATYVALIRVYTERA